MALLIPRLHLFEIDDQPWFPSFLRRRFQDALAEVWIAKLPGQTVAPAELAASLLIRELGSALTSYTFIDFCAGGGGPTPAIEQAINGSLLADQLPPVDFIVTDLHPNIDAWAEISRKSPRISYWKESVDATRPPASLLRQGGEDKKTMRLFNLSFHHFDDPLARSVLKNTVETSEGFAIFELQQRTLGSIAAFLFGNLVVMLAAPYYAWKWRSPATFIFSWVIPILPLTMLWDSCVSCLRTRTPVEVETLLHTCGADASRWEMRSGSETYHWPHGNLNWIICTPVDR